MTRLKKDFSKIFAQDLVVFLRDYDSYGFAFDEIELNKARLKDIVDSFYKIYDFPKNDRKVLRLFPLVFNVLAGTASTDGKDFPSCVFGFGDKKTPTKAALVPLMKNMSFYAVVSGYQDSDYFMNEIDPQDAYVRKEDLVKDIVEGQFEDPAYILYFDLAKGSVKDVSPEIAEEWFDEIFWELQWACEMETKTHDDIPPFIEEHHKNGSKLWRSLPMPQSSPY